MITRGQLLALGFSAAAIRHWTAAGRLHPIWRGVHAAGRRDLSREGLFIAAVLACGDGAVLSHASAAIHWGVIRGEPRVFEVTVPARTHPRRPRVKTHRRKSTDATPHEGIPLRALLDRDTHVLTDTELEQRLVPIARRAGLPKPETQVWLNGHRVDFFFRELGVVVEANSLRFHRTPSQQANDSRRAQAHLAAGLLPVPFTHWQITFDPAYVEATLRAVASRAVDSRPSRSSRERPNFTTRR